MADERIEVEWIATAQQMVGVLDKISGKLDKQEKELQRIGTTSKKSADMAAGSFNKLEQELKEAEAALKGLAIGGKGFDEQRRKVDALRASVERAKESLTADPRSAVSWTAAGKAMGGVTAAAYVLYAALQKIAQAQRDVVAGAADEIVNLDTMARRMQIQAGLTDPERQQQSIKIISEASAAGVTAETGFRAATQLAGSGFEDAVDSGTLTTILDTIQASSFQGSPEQLVSAFSEALNAYGLEKTNENLQSVAVAAQSLFKQTDFQLTELQDFAKQAATFESANMQLSEALAAFTALRETLPAAESGTGLRNFVNKLQQGDLTRENRDNMQRLGITAEQVDFVGESLIDVINNIRTATDQMPEADRNAALGKMFGTENVTSAKLLLQSADRIKELQDSQQQAAVFQKDRDTAAGGMQAELNRIENQRMLDRMPIADRLFEEQQQILERDERSKKAVEEAAVSGIPGAALATQTVTGIADTIDLATGTDKTGFRGMGMSGPGIFNAEFLKYMEEQKAKQEETNRLLTEQNELIRQQQTARMARQQPAVVPQQPIRPQDAPLPVATVP